MSACERYGTFTPLADANIFWDTVPVTSPVEDAEAVAAVAAAISTVTHDRKKLFGFMLFCLSFLWVSLMSLRFRFKGALTELPKERL